MRLCRLHPVTASCTFRFRSVAALFPPLGTHCLTRTNLQMPRRAASSSSGKRRRSRKSGRGKGGKRTPARAPRLEGVGSNPHSTAADKRGREVAEYYKRLYGELWAYLDTSRVSARRLSAAEEEALREIALQLSSSLSDRTLADVGDTAWTHACWQSAVMGADSGDIMDIDKAVERFLSFRFDIRAFPPAGLDPSQTARLVIDFLNKSLVRGTLAEHLRRRVADAWPITHYSEPSYRILCRDDHASISKTVNGAVNEISDTEWLRRALSRISRGPSVDSPIFVGGERGSGRTIRAALIPMYALASLDRDSCATRNKTLVVYTRAGDCSAEDLRAVRECDAALLEAIARRGDTEDLRKRRTEAAGKCLSNLLADAIGWRGLLTLDRKDRFELLFIIVDDLSSQPELLRALLLRGSQYRDLLDLTATLSARTVLILCTTSTHSPHSSDLTFSPAKMGGPSCVFKDLLSRGNAHDSFITHMRSISALAALVENRRIAGFVARRLLDTFGDLVEAEIAAPCGPHGVVQFGSPNTIQGYAGVAACQAMVDYRAQSGLRQYSGEALTAVVLEGLRRLLLWDPESDCEAERLFAAMGDSSPLRLGVFTDDYSEIESSEYVTIAVSRAQLAMAAMRYGAVLTPLPHTAEELCASLFTALLDAVRVVPLWAAYAETNEGDAIDPEERRSVEDNVRVNYIADSRQNLKATDLDKFVSALRGPDAAPNVTLGVFLRGLDGGWSIPPGEDGPATRPLEHTRCAPFLSLEELIKDAEDMRVSNAIGEVNKELFPDMPPKKIASTVVNAPEASHADFFVVCGDFLFLAKCRLSDGGWGEGTTQVRKELMKMGFSVRDDTVENSELTLSKKYEKNQKLTQDLMNKFECKFAVPLFFVSEIPWVARGREVVAVGHGWDGPVPFVRLEEGLKKRCTREKTPSRGL